MSKFDSLSPEMKALWSRVYASVVANVVNLSENVIQRSADRAEECAWEAVRRANGWMMPEEREQDTDSARLAVLKEAIEQPCPVTGEPFFMVIRHPDLGWVPTYGGPHDSWTAPERDEGDDAPFKLFRYHYDHDDGSWHEYEAMGLTVSEDQRPREESPDDMIAALAPIVAEEHLHTSMGGAAHKTRALRAATRALQGHESEAWAEEHTRVTIAAWKAARGAEVRLRCWAQHKDGTFCDERAGHGPDHGAADGQRWDSDCPPDAGILGRKTAALRILEVAHEIDRLAFLAGEHTIHAPLIRAIGSRLMVSTRSSPSDHADLIYLAGRWETTVLGDVAVEVKRDGLPALFRLAADILKPFAGET